MDKKKRRKKWLIVLGSVWLFFYFLIWIGEKYPPQPQAVAQNAVTETQAHDAQARAKAQIDAEITEVKRQEQATKREQAAQRRKAEEDAAFWQNKEALDSREAADWSRDHPAEYSPPALISDTNDSSSGYDASSALPKSGDDEKKDDTCREHKQSVGAQLDALRKQRESLRTADGDLPYHEYWAAVNQYNREKDALDEQIIALGREWNALHCK